MKKNNKNYCKAIVYDRRCTNEIVNLNFCKDHVKLKREYCKKYHFYDKFKYENDETIVEAAILCELHSRDQYTRIFNITHSDLGHERWKHFLNDKLYKIQLHGMNFHYNEEEYIDEYTLKELCKRFDITPTLHRRKKSEENYFNQKNDDFNLIDNYLFNEKENENYSIQYKINLFYFNSCLMNYFNQSIHSF